MSRGIIAAAAVASMLLAPNTVWAVDSYRWLRVTIDTPWAIFIFLLPMVLIPIVLLAILYWRVAFGSSKVAAAVPDVIAQESAPAIRSDKL